MKSKVVRRYSTALFESADSLGILKEVESDISLILHSIHSVRNLKLFFKSPVISRDKKIKVVKELYGSKVNKLTLNYLYLLIKKTRENMIEEILNDFLDLKDLKEGIVNAEIKSAVKLSDDTLNALKIKIDEYTNLNSRLFTKIDKNLIGGFTVKIDDTVLDASIKRQLEMLKQKFLKAGN